MKQALIPAAGMGSRLGGMTRSMPKCMLKINGETLIARCLRQLDELRFDRIVIITGHERDKLVDHVESLNIETKIVFIHNPDYYNTNNIVSVSMAFEQLDVLDTVLIESDLIFEKELLTDLLSENSTQVVISKFENHMDGTLVELKQQKMEFINKHESLGNKNIFKTVNIYYFTRDFINDVYKPLLNIYLLQGLYDSYYELPLKLVSDINLSLIKAHVTTRKWFEVDDINDLDLASNMFSFERLNDTLGRYGGFWRFEDKKDFVYLSNPYFPNEDFFSDIERNLRSLIHHYPSSQRVNSKLMSGVLDVHEDFIIVGNGASEIINIVSDHYPSQTILSPTFKEYENRCKNPKIVHDLNEIYESNHDCVVIVNPNNPDGKMYKYDDLFSLITKMPNTTFIIDESFMEFASNPQSLLSEELLGSLDNLLIVKSIGKSHGIGGLRLGTLIGKNAKLYRDSTDIWNINSLSEYFMQRFKKYEKSYLLSLELIKEQRNILEQKLEKILGISIVKSEGNFVYFEVSKKRAEALQMQLFSMGFIIKLIDTGSDISGIRIAIRNGLDNYQLCEAVKKFCSNEKM